MKTAVCFTGQCRSLEFTHESIKENLLNCFEDCDVFMYVSDNEDAFKAEKYMTPTEMRIEPDIPIDEININHQQAIERGGLQGYLQMLHGLKKCNEMRVRYEEQHGIKYDRIIRSRLDIKFFKPVSEHIKDLDLNYLYIPDFHCWDIVQGAGYNDRFAISNRTNMNIYLNEVDFIRKYSLQGFKIHAESTLCTHLKSHGIKVKTLPIRFTRVRKGGVEEDNYIAKDPATWPQGEGCACAI